jgi:hypothetical protein
MTLIEPVIVSVLRERHDAFPYWGTYNPETELCGWATRIRTTACTLYAATTLDELGG